MATTTTLQQAPEAAASQAGASQPKERPRCSRLETFNNSRTQALDVFSPVNENGSYEFDRLIMAGEVNMRTRKTKTWKPMYLVLRPNTLSIYKDSDGTKLRHQIRVSEITAVARQKDPKARAKHVFGVFSPARNLHLSAKTSSEATNWVNRIRERATIDEEDDELVHLVSPLEDEPGAQSNFGLWTIEHPPRSPETPLAVQNPAAMVSSSSEPEGLPIPARQPGELHSAAAAARRNSLAQSRRNTEFGTSYSGNDMSVSDLSDVGGANRQEGMPSSPPNAPDNTRPPLERAFSSTSLADQIPSPPDKSEDRIIYEGWLHLLKTKGGVRQWKRMWAVLRPNVCTFYKNSDEYSAVLVLPVSSILSAIEINPISKRRPYCLQLITEDRNYRFATSNEGKLTAWLGGFLSLLAKRTQVLDRQNRERNLRNLPPTPYGPVEEGGNDDRSRGVTTEANTSKANPHEGKGGRARNAPGTERPPEYGRHCK